MSRVSLDTYYNGFFKVNDENLPEEFREINRGHVISSEYYDIQFGRNSLIYRDKIHRLVIPTEHDVAHTLIVYLHYFFEKNKCDIAEKTLQERISKTLTFLSVKYKFEEH
jgi:hypothetical protein